MFISETIPNRPTGKLLFASALLILATAMVLFDEHQREGMALWSEVLLMIVYSFFILYAVIEIPAFQTLVGILALIPGLCGGLMILANSISTLFGHRPVDQFSDIAGRHLIILWFLLVGHLLAIDKDIAEYRRQLRLHFSEKDRLDPKVDNLPDDPINPS
ncbi:MAG: hypothetical protein ABL974_21645 [Prosthecobacter sp.]